MFCCVPHCETITGFQGCTVVFAVVAQMVGALRYMQEGCGFDSRWGHWDFSLTTITFLDTPTVHLCNGETLCLL